MQFGTNGALPIYSQANRLRMPPVARSNYKERNNEHRIACRASYELFHLLNFSGLPSHRCTIIAFGPSSDFISSGRRRVVCIES